MIRRSSASSACGAGTLVSRSKGLRTRIHVRSRDLARKRLRMAPRGLNVDSRGRSGLSSSPRACSPRSSSSASRAAARDRVWNRTRVPFPWIPLWDRDPGDSGRFVRVCDRPACSDRGHEPGCRRRASSGSRAPAPRAAASSGGRGAAAVGGVHGAVARGPEALLGGGRRPLAKRAIGVPLRRGRNQLPAFANEYPK